MNAIKQAMQDLGLTGKPFGTTEELPILNKLEELSSQFSEHADLFILAADAVAKARSAGHETIDPNSVFAARRSNTAIQLRYRGEMVDVFEDIMIDLALRGALHKESADEMGSQAVATSGAVGA